MTIQEQKDEAYKAYEAIRDSAYEAYRAKMKEIEATEDIIEIKGVKYKKI